MLFSPRLNLNYDGIKISDVLVKVLTSSPEGKRKKENKALVLCLSLSRVQLFATPWTVALQAPLSMGFSRQEYWSRLPCPPPRDLPKQGIQARSPTLQADSLPFEPPGKPNKAPAAAAAKSRQLCPTLCDPIDSSPPGSPVPRFCRQEHWRGLPFPSPMHEN